MANQSSQERISEKLHIGNGTKTHKKNIVIFICILAVIIIFGIIGLLLFFKLDTTEKRNVVVTPENVEETLEQMKEKTQAGQYEVTMNTTWEFEKGDSASTNAYVENSTSNANDVYFDVIRNDTGEAILKSPIIPVGSHLENITLDKPLDAGTHACMLTYHLLDSSGNPVSKLNINLKIHVAD
jgi:hypothetical protein